MRFCFYLGQLSVNFKVPLVLSLAQSSTPQCRISTAPHYVSIAPHCCISIVPHCWVSQFHIATFPQFHNSIAVFPQFYIAEFPQFHFSTLPRFHIGEFPQFHIAGLPQFHTQISLLQHYIQFQVTKLPCQTSKPYCLLESLYTLQ